MKSVLVIGMGCFGRHLASKLSDMGNDVMVVDKSPEIIEKLSSMFTDSYAGDFTNEPVVNSIGINDFDICFVTIGDDFESSLVITSILKKQGARFVVAKASQEIQSELLKKIGADEIIDPDREMAEKTAVRYNAKNVFDFIQLTSEYSIYEIPVVPSWVGKTVSDIDVRKKYKVNIIAVKSGNRLNPIPGADYSFEREDHIVVIGRSEDVFRLSSKT